MKVSLKRFNAKGNGFNYVVLLNAAEIGSIYKIKDTTTETHPWKAYFGIGQDYRYIGAFYTGKQDAVSAVVAEFIKLSGAYYGPTITNLDSPTNY